MPKKNLSSLTMEELKALEARVSSVVESSHKEEPFWSYEPSDGLVSPERRAFLAEWLKPEDVPQGRLNSQRDIHLCESPIILAGGGNQGGKTALATVEGIIWSTGALPVALEKIYPKSKLPTQWPVCGRVTCVDNNSLAMVILKAWQKWTPRRFLLDGSWEKSWSAEHKILTLYSSDRREIAAVQFKTNEQKTRSFQGNPLHWATFDEQPDKDKDSETRARFITADKLKILYSMTPTEGITWVKEEILDKEDGKRISCFKMPSICNKYAQLATLRAIFHNLPYQEIKMRLLGAFVSLSGMVYGNLYSDDVHLIAPFPLRYQDFIVYRGVDPHLVKASACTEVAVDPEDIQYVTGCYQRTVDTQEFKDDLAERAAQRNYRLGWTAYDKSANSDIMIFGGRNVAREIGMGANAIPALKPSQKFAGSILTGVDQIKQLLKVNPDTGEPGIKIFDIPETLPLRQAFKNMERDAYINEDKKGKKDAILEGKFDNHACLRYINQRVVRWLPPVQRVPEYTPVNLAMNY